jgi:Tol biopolymer transport system component
VINLGDSINSHGYDGSPYVTADDQYLIFTSSRHPELPNEEELFNVFYVEFDMGKYRSLVSE